MHKPKFSLRIISHLGSVLILKSKNVRFEVQKEYKINHTPNYHLMSGHFPRFTQPRLQRSTDEKMSGFGLATETRKKHLTKANGLSSEITISNIFILFSCVYYIPIICSLICLNNYYLQLYFFFQSPGNLFARFR